MKLSLIIPCYNEEAAAPIFHREATEVLRGMDAEYEMLFINDGSQDQTLAVLRSLAAQDPHVTYLSFSRNFGKEAAMYAGFCKIRSIVRVRPSRPPDGAGMFMFSRARQMGVVPTSRRVPSGRGCPCV